MIGIFICRIATAQPVTGVWKGKIDRKNVELKIIKNGDSLTGTCYYYESAGSYRRYSIKGYFNDNDNSVVWWDDQLIEAKNSTRLFGAKPPVPYLSTADFNCPGGITMYLNGKAALREKDEQEKGTVALQKISAPTFNDEWDFIIENYTLGANDPELIDSVGKLAFVNQLISEPNALVQIQQKNTPEKKVTPPKKEMSPVNKQTKTIIAQKPEATKLIAVTVLPLNNEQRFASRHKQVAQEIPISGDSIELRFYDNAEVDGDSIAIFLNSRLLYEHVRLTEKAYSIKLAVAALQQENELVMVAENLGSIPPNTSLMVALVDGKRYEIRLESTELSSAVIRFVRKEP